MPFPRVGEAPSSSNLQNLQNMTVRRSDRVLRSSVLPLRGMSVGLPEELGKAIEAHASRYRIELERLTLELGRSRLAFRAGNHIAGSRCRRVGHTCVGSTRVG